VFSALNTEAIYYNPGAKLPKKEYIFDNMALYFECPISKNVCPLGRGLLYYYTQSSQSVR